MRVLDILLHELPLSEHISILNDIIKALSEYVLADIGLYKQISS